MRGSVQSFAPMAGAPRAHVRALKATPASDSSFPGRGTPPLFQPHRCRGPRPTSSPPPSSTRASFRPGRRRRRPCRRPRDSPAFLAPPRRRRATAGPSPPSSAPRRWRPAPAAGRAQERPRRVCPARGRRGVRATPAWSRVTPTGRPGLVAPLPRHPWWRPVLLRLPAVKAYFRRMRDRSGPIRKQHVLFFFQSKQRIAKLRRAISFEP